MMMRRGPPQHYHHHRPDRPPPQRQYAHWQYGHRHPRDPCPQTPIFVVVLESGRDRKGLSVKELEEYIARCPSRPDSVDTPTGLVGRLLFRQWSRALEAFVYFWGRCLDGSPNLPTPMVVSSVNVEEEKARRLRELFAGRARGLLVCEAVRKVEKKIDEVTAQIEEVKVLLKGHNSIKVFWELRARSDALVSERQQLLDRLEEYRAGINSLLARLEEEQGGSSAKGTVEGKVFELGDVLDWRRIQMMMVRECRRLEDGLPIYACRRRILSSVLSNQVTVLVGETGSGKSTQLVQFLADIGLAAHRSIVCTQPRKIAALSLSQRVREESYGCYMDNSVVSYPTYSSSLRFDPKITFMTDYCLLQHCMNDKSLVGISCVIVDEAHERSLNTDLLLALVKKLLLQRFDLRLIIMSATADANKLSDYFCGCQTVHVMGRNFPVEIKYIPDVSTEASWVNFTKQVSGNSASYVSDVVKMVSVIHKTEENGSILAFLTSQAEVEWACENFQSPSAMVLPLHGKLLCEEQCRVFQNYAGKRKIIFSTNLAETSLTIPGVKYVVDSGMVKESRFEASSGMNVLKVCRVSQSSAQQRAGRAGRTEPGKCYRLYSECEFQLMPLYQEPEIQKVHLGIAVLKILALGIKNMKEFEFIDAPSLKAIDIAIQNLIRLGAISCKDDVLELTSTGWSLVKLGIEPRLGKIILECFERGLSKEGLVLAAVMANASSIFCRVGTDEDKLKADCFKIPFCHPDGDLFTLLSVYKEWEQEEKNRNHWCWQNSINAKSLRRCEETVRELESCLRHELKIIVPSYWKWKPNESCYSKLLKKAILSSLSENVAMYTGCERLGYEVAQTGENIQLHPSCSLHIYTQKPSWVVFSEILSISNQYLVCVTAIERETLCIIQPPPSYDISKMEDQMMQMMVIKRVGSHLLRRLCGKGNRNLQCLVSRVRSLCKDSRADIIVDFDNEGINLFTSSKDMEVASSLVNDAVSYETRRLQNECIEKYLFQSGPNVFPTVALFGSGAEIKHLELEKRFLAAEICHPDAHTLDDKELLMMVDRFVPHISSFCKNAASGQNSIVSDVWGTITFLTPEASAEAVEKLNGVEFCGSLLAVRPITSSKGDHKMFPFHGIRAKLCWPRKRSKGVAFVRCAWQDAAFIVQEFSNLEISGRYVRCEVSNRYLDCVVVAGFDKDIPEPEIFDVIRSATKRNIIDITLLRGDAVDQPSCIACEEALRREIAPFMSSKHHPGGCRVEVFSPDPRDIMMKAIITFDGSLHLEAAKALDHLQGKVLPGCQPWQKIVCQHLFRSSMSCPRNVYFVIKNELDRVLKSFRRIKGVSYDLDRNENGSYRVKLFADATKTMADVRKPLELLMKGKTVGHTSLTPIVLQLLLSRDGVVLTKSVERETQTCIIYDRHNMNLRLFGSEKNVIIAEGKLVQSLLSLHENKQLEICLRGSELPPDLMKEVVHQFGPDLLGLKQKVPGAEFLLNTRYHRLSMKGSKEMKQKVDEIIFDVAKSLENKERELKQPTESTCAICLCELEEPYKLEACGHVFCHSCLVEQCESSVKSHDGFPLCCAQEGCGTLILMVDLRSLLLSDKLEELFRASLSAFVTSNAGTYRFCPSPDCPSVYKVAGPNDDGQPFVCGACLVETCIKCHLEYHPFISCDLYKEYKEQPDLSLSDWMKGKEHVKSCPVCGFTIEKIDGCNHIACRCGKHICWVCLKSLENSDDCYNHLRTIHQSII